MLSNSKIGLFLTAATYKLTNYHQTLAAFQSTRLAAPVSEPLAEHTNCPHSQSCSVLTAVSRVGNIGQYREKAMHCAL